MVCQDDGRMAFMGLASMRDDAGAARSSWDAVGFFLRRGGEPGVFFCLPHSELIKKQQAGVCFGGEGSAFIVSAF